MGGIDAVEGVALAMKKEEGGRQLASSVLDDNVTLVFRFQWESCDSSSQKFVV